MPTKKRKTTSNKQNISNQSSGTVALHFDMPTKILLAIAFVAVFMIGLILTDMMSRAMAAVIVNGYYRQVSIGNIQFDSPNRVIATGFSEARFQATSQPNIYDVTASINIPVGNILTYQLFTATSSDPWALTDMNVYGCLQQLASEELNRNTIFVGCTSTSVSPIIPEPGSLIIARYYYVAGEAIYNYPLCGDGVLQNGEYCDDGALNGAMGRCNATCSGIVPAVCGDEVISFNENCDDGPNNGTPGFCNLFCTGYTTTTPPTVLTPSRNLPKFQQQ